MADIALAAFNVRRARKRAEAARMTLEIAQTRLKTALRESAEASTALLEAEAVLMAACDEAPPVEAVDAS